MNKPDLKPGARCTVEVSDLAFQGRGVARIDRLVVFVDGGLPGDTVEIEITRRRQHHLEAKVTELLNPSPSRVTPRCAHFGLCGGCRLQDLAYDKQLEFKASQIRHHLAQIGGIEDPTEIPIIPCEPDYRYRNKMEFTFGKDSAGQLTIGLHPRGKYWDVFDLLECHLPSESFARIVEITRDHFANTANEPYHTMEHTGFLRFLVVREGQNTGQFLVNLVTTAGEVVQPAGWVAALREAVPEITTVVRTINTRRANIAVGDLADIWHGDGTFAEQLGGLDFSLGPLSFFQTNTRQAEKLLAKALEYAALTPEDRVVDLYSGAGAISLFAAQKAGSVTGVELVPEAVTAAKEAADKNGIRNCEFVCADVKDFLKSQDPGGTHYDVVISDPPRAGLHPKVVKYLLKIAPPRIVYVSCNPSTLARDIALLCADRYRLAKVTAVDMFPHTPHIEAVAFLQRVDEK